MAIFLWRPRAPICLLRTTADKTASNRETRLETNWDKRETMKKITINAKKSRKKTSSD